MFRGNMKEFLDNVENFDWGFSVFAEEGEITLSTQCIALDSDDEKVIDSGDYFKVTLEKDYFYFLSISDVQDIFSNLEQQVKNPSDDLKLKALIYYFETDCFLEVTPEA